MRCRFAGGASAWSGRASRLGSRSSVFTSSANSLEAWDESGEADAESAMVWTCGIGIRGGESERLWEPNVMESLTREIVLDFEKWGRGVLLLCKGKGSGDGDGDGDGDGCGGRR